ncbi:MAG: hypothetical protein ACE5E5_12125 [Phycisphaerae bacterium]
MTTELHCPGCSKLIRAPDGAGGKQGKCPYCGRKVYIPMPESEIDPIPLAPIDETEEARAARLRRESTAYIAAIDHVGEHDAAGAGSDSTASQGGTAVETVDVADEVMRFMIAMRDSQLDVADQCVKRLAKAGSKSVEYVNGLMLDELPLRVENVPPPLVQGFLKTLLSRL